jgi:protein-disulfide isomerase
MFAIGRRGLILGASALALGGVLSACDRGGAAGAAEGEMVLGDANAPVTLTEYASTTCPHCAEVHEATWDQLKTNYIDTGRIKFVFREFPTAPAPVAVAGFQVARCGGATPEQYFTRVGEIFRTQAGLFQSIQVDAGRGYFVNLGQAAGLSEDQVLQCIGDESGAARVRRMVEAGERDGVTGTPTFLINGTKFEQAPTYENLSRALDAAGA